MVGLKMPGYPEDMFLGAVKGVAKRNKEIGFAPTYSAEWEKDDFAAGHSMYLRPFSYSEPAIGLGLSSEPWVVLASTLVGSYFRPGNSSATTTTRGRTSHWIRKGASNYPLRISRNFCSTRGNP